MNDIKKRVNEVLAKFNVNLKAEEVKFLEASLDDGTMIYTDAEVWEAGVNVYVLDADGNKVPVPVGEYILADGQIVVIAEDGILGELRAAEVVEEQEVEQSAETTLADVMKAIAALDTKLSAQVKESNDSVAEVAKELGVLKANFSHKGLPKTPKKENPETPLQDLSQKERVNYLINNYDGTIIRHQFKHLRGGVISTLRTGSRTRSRFGCQWVHHP